MVVAKLKIGTVLQDLAAKNNISVRQLGRVARSAHGKEKTQAMLGANYFVPDAPYGACMTLATLTVDTIYCSQNGVDEMMTRSENLPYLRCHPKWKRIIKPPSER